MTELGKTDFSFMAAALEEARAAAERGEVPVCAIVVVKDRIVGRAGNRTVADYDPTILTPNNTHERNSQT